jgi:chorismate mutase-like protein
MAEGQRRMTSSTLDDLRRDIDRVDEVLVRLLNERARCVCEVGRLKKEQGVEVYQPDREKEVLAHVRSVAVEGPLGPDAIARLFERIIDEARRLERRVVHDGLDPLEGEAGPHAARDQDSQARGGREPLE